MSTKNLKAFCQKVSHECYFSKIRILDRWVGSVFERAFKDFEITPHQFNLLVAINSMGDMASAKMLSRYLEMDKSTVSRDLQKLLTKRLLLASANEEDSRNKHLKLSVLGKNKILQCQKSWNEAQIKSKKYLSDNLERLKV